MTSYVSPTAIATIPESLTRPKRLAKVLHRHFPMKNLSDCQATTAHLFGHKDWHALEVATQSNAQVGPFDEDLTPNQVKERIQQHAQIIRCELGNADKTKIGPSQSRGGEFHERLKHASERWIWLFASDVLIELAPTCKTIYPQERVVKLFSEYTIAQVEQLPAKLGEWWNIKIPSQPEVGQALINFKLNASSRTSVLKFAHYWGSLSMHYAGTIDTSLVMGVASMLAETYSSIHALSVSVLYENWLLSTREKLQQGEPANPPPEDVKDDIHQLLSQGTYNFFDVYPRDDFLHAYFQQHQAFEKAAEKTAKILTL